MQVGKTGQQNGKQQTVRGDLRGPPSEITSWGDPHPRGLTTFLLAPRPEFLPCPMGLTRTHLGTRPVLSGLVPSACSRLREAGSGEGPKHPFLARSWERKSWHLRGIREPSPQGFYSRAVRVICCKAGFSQQPRWPLLTGP